MPSLTPLTRATLPDPPNSIGLGLASISLDETHNVDRVDEDIRRAFADDLHPGERILWAGQPGGALLSKADFFVIPFSLAWAGGVFAFAASAIFAGRPQDILFFVPFLLAGVYLTIGRFVIKYRYRKGTVYAVTDERVIERRGRTVRFLALAQLPSVDVTSRGDRGTVAFGLVDRATEQFINTGLGGWSRTGALAFFDIREPQRVAGIIEGARSAEPARVESPYASVRGEF